MGATYRDEVTVYELPPNPQGIATLQMLNLLELWDLKSLGHNSADYLHLHVEAKKLAFADRAKFYAVRAPAAAVAKRAAHVAIADRL